MCKEFYELADTVCQQIPLKRDKLFSSNEELYVNARCALINELCERGYSDKLIAQLSGLTRQTVNRLKNQYHVKYRHSALVRELSNILSVKVVAK